jgi:predicted nucleotidyltransferase
MRLMTDADIDKLLSGLLERIRQILSAKLVGLYLYGSLVAGDFDRDISDIDLLAVTSMDIDEREFALLETMHNDIAAEHPEWEGRLEIAYLSARALKTFKTESSRIAVISPGEPFHFKEAGNDWLINWWTVREKGIVLFGADPATIIEPISKQEFLQAVREQAKEWREWVYHSRERPWQAYAILTMCRALYANANGDLASKKQAARWAQAELPEWASLIENALAWRAAWRDKAVDHEATFPETVGFVHFVIDQIKADE